MLSLLIRTDDVQAGKKPGTKCRNGFISSNYECRVGKGSVSTKEPTPVDVPEAAPKSVKAIASQLKRFVAGRLYPRRATTEALAELIGEAEVGKRSIDAVGLLSALADTKGDVFSEGFPDVDDWTGDGKTPTLNDFYLRDASSKSVWQVGEKGAGFKLQEVKDIKKKATERALALADGDRERSRQLLEDAASHPGELDARVEQFRRNIERNEFAGSDFEKPYKAFMEQGIKDMQLAKDRELQIFAYYLNPRIDREDARKVAVKTRSGMAKIPGKKCGGSHISASYKCGRHYTNGKLNAEGKAAAKQLAEKVRGIKGLKTKAEKIEAIKAIASPKSRAFKTSGGKNVELMLNNIGQVSGSDRVKFAKEGMEASGTNFLERTQWEGALKRAKADEAKAGPVMKGKKQTTLFGDTEDIPVFKSGGKSTELKLKNVNQLSGSDRIRFATEGLKQARAKGDLEGVRDWTKAMGDAQKQAFAQTKATRKAKQTDIFGALGGSEFDYDTSTPLFSTKNKRKDSRDRVAALLERRRTDAKKSKSKNPNNCEKGTGCGQTCIAPGYHCDRPRGSSGSEFDTDGGRIRTARPGLTQRGDESLIPPNIRKHLSSPQKQGVALAKSAMDSKGAFLLADGTGVGKTRQQIAIAKMYADEGKRVLIVSKSGVLQPDWKTGKMAGSFAEDSKDMSIGVRLASKRSDIRKGKVAATTYDRLDSLAGGIDKNTVLILDEAQAFKNRGSARSRVGIKALERADKVLYATATPVDKLDQLDYLGRLGVFGDKTGRQFRRFANSKDKDAIGVYGSISDRFDSLTKDGLMIRRELTMKGVDVNFQTVKIPKQAKDDLAKTAATYSSNADRAQKLMTQRRQLEPYKIPAATKEVNNALKEGRQAIVFVSRVNDSNTPSGVSSATARSLREQLKKAGITDVAELHGSSGNKASDAMNAFQASKARVLITTLESGGTGINLDDTAGNKPRTVVMMTPPFSAVENVQAVGRVWRYNTKSQPQVKYLFSDMPVDKWNKQIISTKMQTLEANVKGEVGALKIPGFDSRDSVQALLDRIDRAAPKKKNCVKGVPVGNSCQAKNRLKGNKEARSPEVGKPGSVAEISPADIKVDPGRFQYKRLSNAQGEVGSLRGVQKYDPNLAGIIQVWKDPADDGIFVTNGHNRLALAKRLGAEKVAVRFLDVPNAKTARAVSALTNIAEGRGDELDAAKFFKESGLTREDLEKKGIPMREKVATNGIAISRLDDSIYRRVMRGDMEPNTAAIIGGANLTGSQQQGLVKLLDSRSKSREITQSVLRELVDTAKYSADKTQTTMTLFGAEEIRESLALERAQLQAGVKRRLAKEKKLFGTVGRATSAESLSRAGNKINVEGSKAVSDKAAIALDTFDRMKNLKGDVSDRINEAARRIADGESARTVESDLYKEILKNVA